MNAYVSATMAPNEPSTDQNLTALFRRRAAERGDHPFLVWRDLDGGRAEWTYGEAAAIIDGVAAGLWDRGVRSGDRVAIHANNSPEFVFACLAIAELGAVMVATNTRSSIDELSDYLARARTVAVFTEPDLLAVVEASAPPNTATIVFDITSDPGQLESHRFRFSELAATTPRSEFPSVDGSAPAGIQFTSGTTGRAKGVVWTQDNYLWAGRVGSEHLELESEDRFLLYLPLFHANAQSYVLMPTVWMGATLILMPRFSTSRFWPIAVEERATVASMIPFSVKALRSQPVPEHTFRRWGNGVIVPSWDERFSVSTVSWWGMTETVSQPIVSRPDEIGHPLAMGRCAPEYEVRIVDDSGAVLDAPAVGLLQVKGQRGVSLFAEYLDDPEATEATFTVDGWLETGDRIEAHDDGWYSFVERDKDMLKIGAENVAALEIERVVNSVAGVREVAVVAGPDPMLDEIPVAFVVVASDAPDDLARQILQRCREQLADFKVPRYVEEIDVLPESLLGKVAKNVLRERAATLVDQAGS